MLTVIAIIGIIAAFAMPVFKNFGKSDVNVSAARQMLDDIGHARQLAMSQRTTVYMVFVPTNYWVPNPIFPAPTKKLFDVPNPSITSTQQFAASNLLDKQLVGYIDMAYGAVGDQPGNHHWHYLTEWQSLPNGVFIPQWKFIPLTAGQPFNFTDPINAAQIFNIRTFNYTNTFPFPTQDSPSASVFALDFPFIAFNYLGQLSDYSGQLISAGSGATLDQDYAGSGIDIPLSQGSVLPPHNLNTKELVVGAPQVTEWPPGNTTNTSYNVIHIDPLSGRATLEFHKQ